MTEEQRYHALQTPLESLLFDYESVDTITNQKEANMLKEGGVARGVTYPKAI